MLICCIFSGFEALFPHDVNRSGVLPPAFPSTSHSPETRLLSSAKLIAGESTSCCGCLSLSGTSAVWWGGDLTRTFSASHSNVSWDGLQPPVPLHSQPEWIMDEMDSSLLKQLMEFSFFFCCLFHQEYTIQTSGSEAILTFSAHSGARLAAQTLISSRTANTFKENKVWVAGACETPCLNTTTVKYLSCSDSVSAGNSTKSAKTYGQWAAKSTEGILVLKIGGRIYHQRENRPGESQPTLRFRMRGKHIFWIWWEPVARLDVTRSIGSLRITPVLSLLLKICRFDNLPSLSGVTPGIN